jgi:putative molybdopterin biosynthesis protein
MGADCVAQVEYTQQKGDEVLIYRSHSPGDNVMAAGSDIRVGEIILRKGQRITSREMGVLAAIGLNNVKIFRAPRIALLSTGNELVEPGKRLEIGKIYDINASSLYAAVVENGGEPVHIGIARDNEEEIRTSLKKALDIADIVIASGSTSAGIGDILYNVVNNLGKPGVIVHGLKVKPGKPAILAVVDDKPIFGLPGYPASALMIFHLIVKPLIRRMAGLKTDVEWREHAKVAFKYMKTRGGMEFLPVVLISREGERIAYPILKGSGAVTSLALADGFIEIPEDTEYLEEREEVTVNLFSQEIKPADLMIIGSNCVGIDMIIGQVQDLFPDASIKSINAGSIGGVSAINREEADIAGIHILDEATNQYNTPILRKLKILDKAVLIRGYHRQQGLIVSHGNPKGISGFKDLQREDLTLINRNVGSGTRILLDTKLNEIAKEIGCPPTDLTKRIKGYHVEANTHSAVAAAISLGKADVGLGIKAVAKLYNLNFIPITDECFDFLVLKKSLSKEAVSAFIEALKTDKFRSEIMGRDLGLIPTYETGTIVA